MRSDHIVHVEVEWCPTCKEFTEMDELNNCRRCGRRIYLTEVTDSSR